MQPDGAVQPAAAARTLARRAARVGAEPLASFPCAHPPGTPGSPRQQGADQVGGCDGGSGSRRAKGPRQRLPRLPARLRSLLPAKPGAHEAWRPRSLAPAKPRMCEAWCPCARSCAVSRRLQNDSITRSPQRSASRGAGVLGACHLQLEKSLQHCEAKVPGLR